MSRSFFSSLPILEILESVLTVVDTRVSLSVRKEQRRWFQEDSSWRFQDLEWRKVEADKKRIEGEQRRLKKSWWNEDLEQCHVDNARTIWQRHVDNSARLVEEKLEVLKSVTGVATLFALFAVVNLTQLRLNKEQIDSNISVVSLYGITTALAEGLMVLSLSICTHLLQRILTFSPAFLSVEAEQRFMSECHNYVRRMKGKEEEDHSFPFFLPPPRSPSSEEFWRSNCEPLWLVAFGCFQFGLSLFLLSLCTVGYLAFLSYGVSLALLSSLSTSLVLIAWLVVQHLYSSHWRGKRSEREGRRVVQRNIIRRVERGQMTRQGMNMNNNKKEKNNGANPNLGYDKGGEEAKTNSSTLSSSRCSSPPSSLSSSLSSPPPYPFGYLPFNWHLDPNVDR